MLLGWVQAIVGDLASAMVLAVTKPFKHFKSRRSRVRKAAMDSAIALQTVILETRTAFGSVISAQDFVGKLDYFADLQQRFLATYAVFQIHATSEFKEAADALIEALPPLIEIVAGHYAARSSPLWELNPWRRLHMDNPEFRALDAQLLAASNSLSLILKPYAARLAA